MAWSRVTVGRPRLRRPYRWNLHCSIPQTQGFRIGTVVQYEMVQYISRSRFLQKSAFLSHKSRNTVLTPSGARRARTRPYLVLKPAVLGVMMPFIFGTESMIPLGDLQHRCSQADHDELAGYASQNVGQHRLPNCLESVRARTRNGWCQRRGFSRRNRRASSRSAPSWRERGQGC